MDITIKSMTGYGRGESTGFDWRCTVEVKTVNHRYCDISIRMPSMMNPYEDRIRKVLNTGIRRGKVEAYIRLDNFGHEIAKIEVNAGVADGYMRAFHKLLERYSVPDRATLSLLTSFHDVFMVDKTISDETRHRVWTVLERAINEAVTQLNEMKKTEGKALYADILEKGMRISDLLKELKSRIPLVADEYEKRLKNRIKEVLEHIPGAEPDESRLLVELALFADRTCIDEEVIRLESHLKQLSTILTEEDAIGRKLDFLVQELQREANTIGSKSGDTLISKLVIDMKSEIEKIREQVQNVE